MQPDLWNLYSNMFRSRMYEDAIAELWKQGLISGEMHLGTGEEAIVAGILAHLQDGDAMALDHRCTPPLLMRGIEPLLVIRELLGHPEGLCGGKGGHMHLFSREHLAATSGIVGASGPTAVGFALAARYLRPGKMAVAFFGEGAMNQGMLMESMNLAAAWKLPVLFVCKDDDWSISTTSASTTRGSLIQRAHGLGLKSCMADGLDVVSVWNAAREAIARIRQGQGPVFFYSPCVHLEGHFLGFQLMRIIRSPIKELPVYIPPLLKATFHINTTPIKEHLLGWKYILERVWSTWQNPRMDIKNDPINRIKKRLTSKPTRLADLESTVIEEVRTVISTALLEVSV